MIGYGVLVRCAMTREGAVDLCFDTCTSACGAPRLPVPAVAMDWGLRNGSLLCGTVMEGRLGGWWRGWNPDINILVLSYHRE